MAAEVEIMVAGKYGGSGVGEILVEAMVMAAVVDLVVIKKNHEKNSTLKDETLGTSNSINRCNQKLNKY